MHVTELVTHSGAFHADEVMAGAVLKDLFPDAQIIRSRDQEMIRPEIGRIVFDVGGVYAPNAMMFDHHQKSAPKRVDGGKFSAFGLIWGAFGNDWLNLKGVPREMSHEIWARMDESIVRIIDGYDNGETSPAALGEAFGISMISLVSDMQPPFDESDAESLDKGYDEARALSSLMLTARAKSFVHAIRARMVVEEAVENARGDSVITLPCPMNYADIIHEIGADHVEFVIYPRPGGRDKPGDWGIGTVSMAPKEFKARRDLPAAWGGLTGADLAEVTGVDDATFCHSGLFIACAQSFEGISQLADIARGTSPAPGMTQ